MDMGHTLLSDGSVSMLAGLFTLVLNQSAILVLCLAPPHVSYLQLNIVLLSLQAQYGPTSVSTLLKDIKDTLSSETWLPRINCGKLNFFW